LSAPTEFTFLMPDRLENWAEQVLAGDRRAVARAISAVEDKEPEGRELVKRLFPKTGRAFVVGITGAPGAGKSTLVEKLAKDYRAAGRTVGICAVDPTSPFTGGAVLGDRIRMQQLATDEGVYIRSMATRGHLGGLAAAAHDVAAILDAAGFEFVLIETVGVGQDEVEVARLADVTVLLLVPGMGDDVQTFKAGVMEIADIFVVNKADRPGADRVVQEVAAMLSISARPDGRQPAIVKTAATTGVGVATLRQELEKFRASARGGPLGQRRQREQWRARLLELLRERLFEKVVAERLSDGEIDARVEDILARRADPYTVVEALIDARPL
jgi:GTPase